MAEFRKAPDNQPTSNIEFQLKHAEAKIIDWQRSLTDHENGVLRATSMLDQLGHRMAELEWQLEQRKSQEVNGL